MRHSKPAAAVLALRIASGLLAAGLLIFISGLRAAPAHAQDKGKPEKQEEQATYLVAREEISDLFFSESVVLLLPPADQPLVVGLIVNKATKIPLNELFPDNDALKNKTQTIYFGDPVDTDDPGVVFRSPKPVKGAILLFGDVYVSFDRDFIEGLLEKPGQIRDLRLFLGRAQWAPDQLQNETLEGAWYSVQAESSFIFSVDPKYVWHTLSEIAEPSPVVNGECR
jgi:putative transcriptional regulator